MTPNTLEDIYRIFDSIEPDKNGCLNYPTKVVADRYIPIRIRSRSQHFVHRLTLERKLGRPIKDCALHICDNKRCVNPNHLYEGTYKDNSRDRGLRNPESYVRDPEVWRQRGRFGALVRWNKI